MVNHVHSYIHKQSHYIEVAQGEISMDLEILYGTGKKIGAGFGPVGNTEKKLGADYEQLLRVVFSCFQEQKNNLIFFFFFELQHSH